MPNERKEKTWKIYVAATVARNDGVVHPGQKFKDDDVISYKVKKVVKTIGDNNQDPIIKEQIVIAEKTSRKELINSYADDVGIANVLKKVSMSGQSISDAVKAGKFESKQGFVDISKMPDNMVDAYNAVDNGVKKFDQLPKDMKKKMSFEAFVKQFGEKELAAYVDCKVQAALAKQKASAPVAESEKK